MTAGGAPLRTIRPTGMSGVVLHSRRRSAGMPVDRRFLAMAHGRLGDRELCRIRAEGARHARRLRAALYQPVRPSAVRITRSDTSPRCRQPFRLNWTALETERTPFYGHTIDRRAARPGRLTANAD